MISRACGNKAFANSLDADQAHVRPDLDPSCLTLDSVPQRFFYQF